MKNFWRTLSVILYSICTVSLLLLIFGSYEMTPNVVFFLVGVTSFFAGNYFVRLAERIEERDRALAREARG